MSEGKKKQLCSRRRAELYLFSSFPAVEVRLSYLEAQEALLDKNRWVCCAVPVYCMRQESLALTLPKAHTKSGSLDSLFPLEF